MGLRDALESAGVALTATCTTDLLGNPVGGNTQGFRYTGDMAVDLHVGLDKLWGLKGMLLDVSGSWRSGENLSAKDIGNTFTVSQIFGGETVRLYALALEWPSLFDNRVDIRMGGIGAGDDFLASPLYTPFVNFAFDGNPGSVPINIPAFSTYPVATWGLRTKVMPVEPWSVSNQRPGWRARECARALPDPGSFHELLGPLHRAESPWLPRQGSCPNPMTVSSLRTGSSPANPP